MADVEKVPTGDAGTMACGLSSQARLRAGRWYDSGTGQSRAGLGAWPVAFDGGPYQTLLCSWVKFSGPTSQPEFGRVNASCCITAVNGNHNSWSNLTHSVIDRQPISIHCLLSVNHRQQISPLRNSKSSQQECWHDMQCNPWTQSVWNDLTCLLLNYLLVLSQETGWKERLWNDLFCVRWDVKP